MLRIFVHESLSAGAAAVPGGPDRELLAAGVAMRNAIVEDLARLDGVAVTCAVGAACGASPGWQAANVATAAARPGEPAQAFVARMAAVHELCWIVAPETGGELARLHAAVGDARWIGCDAGAIRCAASKRATLAVLAAAGVPTPLGAGASPGGRWLVKPDDGAGCLGTRLHADRAAAQTAAALLRMRGDLVVLEPFVEGEALSVSLIVGADLAEPVSFNRQRIVVDSAGWLYDAGVQAGALDAACDPRVPRLAAAAAAAVRALPGLGGFVGIDMVWNDERGAVVIEINPRVTCAYVGASARLGRNLAADVLRAKGIRATNRVSRDGVRA